MLFRSQIFNMAKCKSQDEIRNIMDQIFSWKAMTEHTVFILEEVQEMKLHEAQGAFLEELTHIPDDVTIIMCTTQLYRMDMALRNRAVCFELEAPSESECLKLIERIRMTYYLPSIEPEVASALIRYNRYTPRSIVKCMELLSSGIAQEEPEKDEANPIKVGANPITLESLEKFYGVIDTHVYVRVFLAIFNKDIDVYDYLRFLEEISKEHRLPTVIRGLKEFALRVLVEVGGIHKDYTINEGDRNSIKEVLGQIGEKKYLQFMRKIGEIRAEIISTKESAEYELLALKDFGLGLGSVKESEVHKPKDSVGAMISKNNVRQAAIERDKAVQRSHSTRSIGSVLGSNTSELKADELSSL